MNGRPLTIVGVGPRGFDGTTTGSPVQVFVPVTMRGVVDPPFERFADRSVRWLYIFGRRRPGVSVAAAQADLGGIYRSILGGAEAPLLEGKDAADLARFAQRAIHVVPGARGQSQLIVRAGVPLALLFVVTGIILAIACANLANLCLARSTARSTELAVRSAIGAARGRLVRQLLVESCALALAGGAAGLLLGQWLLAAIRHGLTPMGFPTLEAPLDWRVLAFGVAISLATGLVFGVFPALHATRAGAAPALKQGVAGAGGGRSSARFRAVMIVVQMTLSTVLLVGAGLFVRSLLNISRIAIGMDVDRLVTFTIAPRRNGYDPEATREFFRRVETTVGQLPGVERVSASTVPLVARRFWGTGGIALRGREVAPGRDDAGYSSVGPSFFATVGIPLVAGRDVRATDTAGAPKVAIVNEAFARKFAPGEDVVGQWMRTGKGQAFDTQIVGLVRDAKYASAKDAVPPVFYTPYLQSEGLGSAAFYVRTRGAPDGFLQAIPAAVARLDPSLPVEDLRTMPQQVRFSESPDRIMTVLALSFAVVATVLSAVGVYGVLAYGVAQRTRELGVRIALGAAPGQVRRLVLGTVGLLTIVGAMAGAGLAYVAGRSLESLLYQLKGTDPLVFGGAVVTLVTVALLSGFAPAWRASRIDPIRALRSE